jgi:delta14-sterol reductase/lamin-B receptor
MIEISAPSLSTPAPPEAEREKLAFGGPVGALTMMSLLPLLTLYLWACVHRHSGSLVLPSVALVMDLPRPSLSALAWLVGWFCFQLTLDVVLPGRDYTGLVQRDGVRRSYRLNGMLSLLVTLSVLAGLIASGVLHGAAVVEQLGALLITSILSSYLFSLVLYRFGKPTRAGAGDVIYGYFMGTALNPRVGRVDLKMFMESKIAMSGWLVLTILMAHAEYERAGAVSLPMMLVVGFQALYTLDFFVFEEAMLSTWDINNENYGFMLAFAFLVWMPFCFSLQSQYLVYADPQLPDLAVLGLILLNLAGYYIFRSSNLQKHRFKTQPNSKIWGREPDFIQTARGTKLLASGWWSLARHSNYLGDLMMALAWCLACGLSHVVPFFYFLYFAPLLIDRERRDDAHCARKYGSDWDRYRERVPYRIVPFIY